MSKSIQELAICTLAVAAVISSACGRPMDPAPASEVSAQAASSQLADQATGDNKGDFTLAQGRYYVQGELSIKGFFRTKKGYASDTLPTYVPDPEHAGMPMVDDSAAIGERLEESYRIDMKSLQIAMQSAIEGTPQVLPILTCQLKIAPSGEMKIEYVGASDGLLAMRGGRGRRMEYFRCYAVEATTRQPVQFLQAGLPGAASGSVVLEFADFLAGDVALQMTAAIEGTSGVIVIDVAENGSIEVSPGVVAG